MHDKRLRDHVMAELEFDPIIDALQISVAVDGGIVTLSGRVLSLREKEAAENAVLRL